MKILLAIDGSDSSDAVLQEVQARPWPADSTFCLVTMIDPFFFAKAPLLMEEAKKNAVGALEEDAQPLRDAGWPVNAQVVMENPRRGISKTASEWKADLILLGSHGRGAFGRLLLGSTAQAILRHAPCSVEIVRRREKEKGMRVLIPTDGSEYAQKALRAGAERPWPQAAEFKVISIPEIPMLIGDYPYYSPEQLAALTKASEDHAKEWVENGASALKNAGLRVATEVTEAMDAPARAILAAADDWHADLIMMGSHGRRGFDRVILGSVSESVALHAHCSVEVTR